MKSFQLSEPTFLAKLNSEIALAASYEDPEAKAEARKVVPIERLENLAREKSKSVPNCSAEVFKDFLLSELVNWFKTEFFLWFDGLVCPSCRIGMQNNGLGTPTPQESADGAGRVEL